MLCSLSVRNVLLIGRLDIEFGEGLNVLTGETGAGKSILLDSAGFVLGRHGRTNLNSGQGGPSEVSASFDVSGNCIVRAVLDELEIPCGDELFLRRVLPETGRTRSFVNDRRCTVEALGRIGEALVELHGQSDTGGLSNPGNHRRLLDRFAGHDLLVSGARRAWRELRSAEDELSRTVERLKDADREREYSEHAVRELEDLDPKAGEDAELDRRRSTMKLFARFRENLAKAEAALGAEGADGCMNDALRWLESASRLDEASIGEISSALDRALLELSEAQRLLDGIRRSRESEPREIEEVEERLFAIRALARKHSVQPDDLEEVAQLLAGNLQDADRLKEEAKRLETKVGERRSEYGRICRELSASRSDAAGKLDSAMQKELAPLRLGRTRFRAEVAEESCGPEGADGVAFNVSTDRVVRGLARERQRLARIPVRDGVALHPHLHAEQEPGVRADLGGRRLGVDQPQVAQLAADGAPVRQPDGADVQQREQPHAMRGKDVVAHRPVVGDARAPRVEARRHARGQAGVVGVDRAGGAAVIEVPVQIDQPRRHQPPGQVDDLGGRPHLDPLGHGAHASVAEGDVACAVDALRGIEQRPAAQQQVVLRPCVSHRRQSLPLTERDATPRAPSPQPSPARGEGAGG